MEFTDSYFPVLVTTKVMTEMRIVGKIAGRKQNVFLSYSKAYLLIKR